VVGLRRCTFPDSDTRAACCKGGRGSRGREASQGDRRFGGARPGQNTRVSRTGKLPRADGKFLPGSLAHPLRLYSLSSHTLPYPLYSTATHLLTCSLAALMPCCPAALCPVLSFSSGLLLSNSPPLPLTATHTPFPLTRGRSFSRTPDPISPIRLRSCRRSSHSLTRHSP
jgi:hypothetical protein